MKEGALSCSVGSAPLQSSQDLLAGPGIIIVVARREGAS